MSTCPNAIALTGPSDTLGYFMAFTLRVADCQVIGIGLRADHVVDELERG